MQRLAGIAIFTATALFLALSAHAMPDPGDDGPSDPAVIDNTGAARFRIPIEVPPGPGGFAPNLELAYSSRSGDGPFGIGWTLGIPEIRCSERFGVPNYASCAKYELDNVLLIVDPANANSYHTFVESFRRILHDPVLDLWTVEQPNGTKLIFGENAGHRIAQGSSTARWLLQRMEDAFGNKVFLEYDTATDIGSAYLKSVFYGFGATSTLGPREVRFEYQVRPDTRNVYSGGIERNITRRLREIQVFGHGEIFRRYAFGYSLGSVTYTTDRSRLSWVQEFGTDCFNPSTDPVASCTGLPRQEFRYRSAPGSYENNIDGYRIPFGSYPTGSTVKRTFPQLIGDINGDGLPDRLQLVPNPSNTQLPGTMSVLLNTGTGFSYGDTTALAYQASFDSLKYLQPGLDYQQIPSPGVPASVYYEMGVTWPLGYATGTMFAMCSVTPRLREATLSEELSTRGFRAATSSLAALRASEGAPSAGWFEPRPTVKLVDIDADGLADLVVSVRLSGVDRNFDCNDPETPLVPLVPPEHIAAQTVAVVFRNTGSGWEKDEALAKGLPPFEEVIVKSSYQAEYDEPAVFLLQDQMSFAGSPCANYSYLGFEQSWDISDVNKTAVCHVPIDLAPQFIDFNGDGYLDLAVLQRRDPDLLWTGQNPGFAQYAPSFERNNASTRVWIQTPNASDRWARAPQYDLPSDVFENSSDTTPTYTNFAHVKLFHVLYMEYVGIYCLSWRVDFLQCGPNTYSADSGVRLADMNGDGLADVVWNRGAERGVLLNRGSGSNPYSAWCASNADDALLVGSSCPDAVAYVPPESFIFYTDLVGNPTSLPQTTGWLRDLNGDGLLDFVRILMGYSSESWIQSPAPSGTPTPTRWLRNEDFDFPINWNLPAIYGGNATIGLGNADFLPGIQIFDINGDGSADFVSDQQALLSQSIHSDLIEWVDNGRGGKVGVEYAAAITQRNAVLEDAAKLDVQPPERPDGGNAAVWRSTPVVSRIRLTGNGFAEAITDYRYAHPRYCTAFRSDLGFRLVEQTRPDASKVEEYFYQDHGRAGHTSQRLVKDAGQVVHRYQATWNLVTNPIPEVFVGRLASEKSAYEYANGTGALLERFFSYDDGYGYNFVREIKTVRPTGTLFDTRFPVAVDTPYVPGRIAQRTLTDETAKVLRNTKFFYQDLAGNPTGPKLGSRQEFIVERGAAGGAWVDVVKLRYDALGNRTEEWTPSPTGGGRSVLFCYDGDVGWCQSQGPSGQTSHSVVVASKDPLGKVTRLTPDLRSGIIVGTSSDYTDEPESRITLDPFGRPRLVYARPTGGFGEILVAENRYSPDENDALRVERFEYVDETASGSIYSAEIFGSFGGVWKTIRRTKETASLRYAGTMTFWDPTATKAWTTPPLDCGGDATCAEFTGEDEEDTAIREVETDAVGRPIRITTPDGSSLLAYRSAANRWGGLGYLDAVLEKNAKGDLVERALDGDRTGWVDECQNGVAAGTASLAGVACGAADTTRYTFEATGEIRRINDPRAVVSSNFSDASHRLRYTYDTLGRIVRIDDPDLEGTGFSKTTYTDAGTLASTTNARNQVRTFDHDILGRLTGIVTPDGEDDYTVEYGSNQWQRAKDSSPAYERVRSYDGWGRVKQTQLSVVEDGGANYGSWSGTYFMDFEYDVAGRPVEVVYPESTVVRYEYEGAYLKRVCDLGTAANCSDSSVVKYVSDVSYDWQGRRTSTASAAGTRTFTYDGSLSRLKRDRFDAPSSPNAYFLELNYDAYDALGNLTELTGSSQPGDIDLNQSFAYDRRNRLASWTHQGIGRAYAYDDLGNLTNNAGAAQAFNAPTRPHSLESGANGTANYGHDADGNVAVISAPGSTRYFQFDSANRMVCAGSANSGCSLNRLHYDVDGRRVLDDSPPSLRFVAFVDDDVNLDGGLVVETRIEIRAFGERIAYKRSGASHRTAGLGGGASWGLPPAALELLAGLAFLGLLAWLAKRGALVLVIERPGYAGVSALLVVALVLGPFPGVRLSNAGGGGGASFYWELADRLGTGMVMLDETGARQVHRTYSPFGVEQQASANTSGWLPRHYAGHLADEDSGLVYMQARWMDPQSGTFLSIDPVVADARDPQAFNGYAYARNNPVSYIDPTGGEACTNFIIGIYCPGPEGGIFPPEPPSEPAGAGDSGPGPSAAPIDTIGNPLSGLQTGGGATQKPDGDLSQGEIQLAALKGQPVELVVGPFLPLALPGVGAIRGAKVIEEGISGLKLLETPREILLRRATDPRVRDVINELFRPGAKLGSGSSMDAFRREGSHAQKLFERRTQLQGLLRDPKLGQADRTIVRELLTDIQNALSGN